VVSITMLLAVILLIEFSVELEILSFMRLDLGAAAFAVVCSTVVVVNGAWLCNGSVLGNLLVLPLDLSLP